MNNQGSNHFPKWPYLFQIVLVLIVLFMPVGLGAAPEAHLGKINPLLIEAAETSPGDSVRVIVQRTGQDDQAEHLVAALGGRVVRDLPIINSFSAVIGAGEVIDLAASGAVRRVTIDAPVVSTGGGGNGGKGGNGGGAGDPLPKTYYLDTLRVRDAWSMGYQGQGVAVAVIDSGVQNNGSDFNDDPKLKENKQTSRIVVRLAFNEDLNESDNSGHGTHVGGIIGGNGAFSSGYYSGIAPKVNLISLAVSNLSGEAYESDTVAALQWVLDNQAAYNIRVVNLSVSSTVADSYHNSGLNAAVEILWLRGIVVVASAGNFQGTANISFAPANDPFIITVGATAENGNAARANDTIAAFSNYGTTQDGYSKPDILAPGTDIISVLAGNSKWETVHPDRAIAIKGSSEYFRASGTSMAAPMVSGAAALLLQAEPNLTPNQVKYRLTQTGSLIDGYRYLDVFAALTTPTTQDANQGVIPHMLLARMAMIAYWASENGGGEIDWASVDWGTVNWDAVNWNAVNWNAVNWNAVNWNAVNWNAVNWNAVNWNAVNWNMVNWNSVSLGD